MTEAEWLFSHYQSELLKLVRGGASERKRRLFSCAVVRCDWKWLKRRNQRAVEVAGRRPGRPDPLSVVGRPERGSVAFLGRAAGPSAAGRSYDWAKQRQTPPGAGSSRRVARE